MNLFLLVACLAAPPDLPADQPLEVRCVVYPQEVALGDVIYVAAYIKNVSPDPQPVFSQYFQEDGSLGITAGTQDGSQKRNFPPKSYALIGHSEVMLPPGEERLAGTALLAVPVDVHESSEFWRRLAEQQEGSEGVVVYLTAILGRIDQASTPIKVTTHPRPEKESELMMRLREEFFPRKPIKERFSQVCLPDPFIHHFYIGVGGKRNLLDHLTQQPKDTFSGTLGNYIHLTRLVNQLREQEEHSPERMRETLDQLGEWLETLPRKERYFLTYHLRHHHTSRFTPEFRRLFEAIADELFVKWNPVNVADAAQP